MPRFDIRRAELRDVNALAELDALCFAAPWRAEDFLFEIFENDLAHYLVCAAERGIVACAGLWAVLTEGHIMNVAVHPDFRGLGLGAAVLDELLRRSAEELGLEEFTLEVRAANSAAIRLYERFGFKEEGRRKDYYASPREDAVIMWRRGPAADCAGGGAPEGRRGAPGGVPERARTAPGGEGPGGGAPGWAYR
jgi:ribosomal-protein-alanine N-acetyltransferase